MDANPAKIVSIVPKVCTAVILCTFVSASVAQRNHRMIAENETQSIPSSASSLSFAASINLILSASRCRAALRSAFDTSVSGYDSLGDVYVFIDAGVATALENAPGLVADVELLPGDSIDCIGESL
jgi:hypothetical protein